jgi:hypothetical protein
MKAYAAATEDLPSSAEGGIVVIVPLLEALWKVVLQLFSGFLFYDDPKFVEVFPF